MPTEIQEAEDSALRKLGASMMIVGAMLFAYLWGLVRGQSKAPAKAEPRQ